jgi:hypothetical protein
MAVNYRNRYGDIYTFTKQKDGSVLMEGDFNYVRTGPDFIDPSGGPFLRIGQMLSHVAYDDEFNIIIEGFTHSDKGVIIMTKPHEVDPKDFRHLKDRDIIGGII